VTPEADVEPDEEPAAITKRPAPPKSIPKTAEHRPAGEVHTASRPGVERHACGAWLCKACVDSGGTCPGCDARSRRRGARSEEEGPRGGLQPL